MTNKNNVLWEKHRMYLPDMRTKAIHRCKDCKYFVAIKGRTEVKSGCVVNIKAYSNLEKRIPPIITLLDIIKLVGLEGLEDTIKRDNPDANCCGRFVLRPK